jgi:hypothetical protein
LTIKIYLVRFYTEVKGGSSRKYLVMSLEAF